MLPPAGRLRFEDDLERRFKAYYFEHSLPFVRFGLVLAVLLYAVFGILDVYVARGATTWIWVIRYAVFCPVGLLVLGLTFTRWFRPVMQPVIAGVAALAGLGIVAMIVVAPPSAGRLYYAGLLLVVPWSYSVLQLRFCYGTGACAVIVIGYEIVAVRITHTPPEILVNNNFFFVSATIIGMVAGYTIERGLRTGFRQRRVIEAQRAELASHNVRLDSALRTSLAELRLRADELQASRARIVAAADAERRRIERDLHDGAQQRLTSLAIRLRLAAEVAGPDAELASLLAELGTEVHDTAQELRRLAHGIYPPLLRDSGLAAALSAASRHSPLPTTVQAASLGRYPVGVEAAVYFCCLEALQNAGKHAGEGATVCVRVREDPGTLMFEVADDGAGFDAGSHGLGAGFLNMADRLGAFGGGLRVDSAPGRGTRVTGTVPVTAAVPPRPVTAQPAGLFRSRAQPA